MLSTNEIIGFLRVNKPVFENRFHCTKIGLFGSFARNEQTEKSDIDILVVYKPDTPNLYDIEIELKNYIGSQFHRKVDICSEKWIKPIFKPLILKDAIYA
jgi:uncharacterized protein